MGCLLIVRCLLLAFFAIHLSRCASPDRLPRPVTIDLAAPRPLNDFISTFQFKDSSDRLLSDHDYQALSERASRLIDARNYYRRSWMNLHNRGVSVIRSLGRVVTPENLRQHPQYADYFDGRSHTPAVFLKVAQIFPQNPLGSRNPDIAVFVHTVKVTHITRAGYWLGLKHIIRGPSQSKDGASTATPRIVVDAGRLKDKQLWLNELKEVYKWPVLPDLERLGYNPATIEHEMSRYDQLEPADKYIEMLRTDRVRHLLMTSRSFLWDLDKPSGEKRFNAYSFMQAPVDTQEGLYSWFQAPLFKVFKDDRTRLIRYGFDEARLPVLDKMLYEHRVRPDGKVDLVPKAIVRPISVVPSVRFKTIVQIPPELAERYLYTFEHFQPRNIKLFQDPEWASSPDDFNRAKLLPFNMPRPHGHPFESSGKKPDRINPPRQALLLDASGVTRSDAVSKRGRLRPSSLGKAAIVEHDRGLRRNSYRKVIDRTADEEDATPRDPYDGPGSAPSSLMTPEQEAGGYPVHLRASPAKLKTPSIVESSASDKAVSPKGAKVQLVAAESGDFDQRLQHDNAAVGALTSEEAPAHPLGEHATAGEFHAADHPDIGQVPLSPVEAPSNLHEPSTSQDGFAMADVAQQGSHGLSPILNAAEHELHFSPTMSIEGRSPSMPITPGNWHVPYDTDLPLENQSKDVQTKRGSSQSVGGLSPTEKLLQQYANEWNPSPKRLRLDTRWSPRLSSGAGLETSSEAGKGRDNHLFSSPLFAPDDLNRYVRLDSPLQFPSPPRQHPPGSAGIRQGVSLSQPRLERSPLEEDAAAKALIRSSTSNADPGPNKFVLPGSQAHSPPDAAPAYGESLEAPAETSKAHIVPESGNQPLPSPSTAHESTLARQLDLEDHPAPYSTVPQRQTQLPATMPARQQTGMLTQPRRMLPASRRIPAQQFQYRPGQPNPYEASRENSFESLLAHLRPELEDAWRYRVPRL